MSSEYGGMRALVMGLGLNGGGLESARFLASRGADVTVTDLRDEKVLAPSIEKLSGLPVRYVLGRHEMEDFARADLVVKNPAVRPDSPYLAASRRVETDISLFLAACPSRICAVTGSKGKSGTSSALHWALSALRERPPLAGARVPGKAYLGGNITVSPLTFLDALRAEDDVVLELSSWQLGDLAGRLHPDGGTDALGRRRALLKPRVAVITSIMRDHLDRYGTMEAYVADKKIIYSGQDPNDATVSGCDDWGDTFARETRARALRFSAEPLGEGMPGAWLEGPEGRGLARLDSGALVEIVPPHPAVPGRHQKMNLLAAGLALLDLGLPADPIREALGSYPGIEHRLEFFHESRGVRYYNDTAATIPEAAAAAVRAFGAPTVLVTGGTDKALDFSPLGEAAAEAKAVVLLAGSGTAKLAPLLDRAGIPYRGPYDDLDAATRAAAEAAGPGDAVVLSPGCASFGMFLNEFDRGRKWKDSVRRLS